MFNVTVSSLQSLSLNRIIFCLIPLRKNTFVLSAIVAKALCLGVVFSNEAFRYHRKAFWVFE